MSKVPDAKTKSTISSAAGCKERLGIVVRDKMQKTVVVEVLRLAQHRVYKKIVKEKIRYKVHNDDDRAKLGDKVRIVETHPLSKEKRWRVAEVLKS